MDRSPELARAPRSFGYAGLLLITAYVTEEDIAEGRKGDGSSCAIARAFLRNPNVDWIHLEGEAPFIRLKDGNNIKLSMPQPLVEWIGMFDRGEPVWPMELNYPPGMTTHICKAQNQAGGINDAACLICDHTMLIHIDTGCIACQFNALRATLLPGGEVMTPHYTYVKTFGDIIDDEHLRADPEGAGRQGGDPGGSP